MFLRLPQFLQLLKHYYQQAQIAEHSDKIPTNSGYLIQDIQLTGRDIIYSAEHKDTHAHFVATYAIDILEKRLPNFITDAIFHHHGSSTESKTKQAAVDRKVLDSVKEEVESWSCVRLLGSATKKVSLTNWKVVPKDNTATLEAYVGIYNGDLVLLCNYQGVVTVEVEFDTAYAKIPDPSSITSPKQLILALPYSVKNNLKFQIDEEDLQVKVNPTLHTKTVSEDGFTLVACEIPPTSSVSIQWTPQQRIQVQQELEVESEDEAVSEGEEEKKLPVTITADQNVSHAIGEGLVKSSAIFDYSIANGSITTLAIQIENYGKPFKVLSVNGSGIKKWDVFNEQVTADEDELIEAPTPTTANKPQATKKVIQIVLSYGIERNYRLQVDTELEMGGTSAISNVPIFCTQNVTREKGSLGVVARTNVEIKEESCKYLQRVDPSELPSYSSSPFPILHAYKFLESSHELKLNVTRHDDAAVLSACIEKCEYKITYSQGRLMHDIKMRIKNTGKQYLRVRTPDTKGEIYSTIVDNQAVKPASETKENERYILLPLTKSMSQL